MKIVLITETLVTGGAETFVLRMATALKVRGHDVVLFVLRPDKIEAELVNSISPDVPIVTVNSLFLKIIMKLDGLFFLLGIPVSIHKWLKVKRLKHYLITHKPDILHSHLFTSDIVVATAVQSYYIPWVTTMHGDYLFYDQVISDRPARILNFKNELSKVEQFVANIVCISDQQLKLLETILPAFKIMGKITKIYNGYDLSSGEMLDSKPKLLASIPDGAFIIGMVSRGIPEKGWEILIKAFLNLNNLNCWLVLVGGSDYMQALRHQYQHSQIIFTGNVVNTLNYIKYFDVGCLPSQYKSESLPTVVIEYLLLGKPVIATNVGEISTMLNISKENPAGLLIDGCSTENLTIQLQAAMQQLYSDKALRQFLGRNTNLAIQKFDMQKCVDTYLNVYHSVLQ